LQVNYPGCFNFALFAQFPNGEEMSKLTQFLLPLALITAATTLQADDAEKAVVITSEHLAQRCILSVIVTAVDGVPVKDTDPSGRYEFEPGEHSISGYGGDDPSLCSTLAGEDAVEVAEGDRIGDSTLKFDVVAGKSYWLGIDVRSKDKSSWKVVTWKIHH
jgi:hypothetical protein